MKNKKLFAILTLVCFMLTLMPVAAFADTTVYAEVNEKYEIVTVNTPIVLDITNGTDAEYYLFAMKDGKVFKDLGITTASAVTVDGIQQIKIAGISESGTYDIYVVDESTRAKNVVAKYDKMDLTRDEAAALLIKESNIVMLDKQVVVKPAKSAYTIELTTEDPLNADSGYSTMTVVATLTRTASGNTTEPVVGATLKISTNSSAVDVDATEVKTNAAGKAKFKVSASTAGEFKVYVEYGTKADATLTVNPKALTPAKITTVAEPKNPVALDQPINKAGISFTISDANGNTLNEKYIATVNANAKVKVLEKPAGSAVDGDDIQLTYNPDNAIWLLTSKANADVTLDEEGTYSFKVALSNGSYATGTVIVKEFQTPVALKMTYKQNAVELNGIALLDKLYYVDANGVEKSLLESVTSLADPTIKVNDVKNVKLAANGYAVDKFYAQADKGAAKSEKAAAKAAVNAGTVKVKADEKYVGSKITVVAVDTKYNLTASVELTVANEAAAVKYASTKADVAVNNTLTANIVDQDGNKVALNGTIKDQNISYVVLEKPENAKVAVSTVSEQLAAKGQFKVSFTASEIGTYKLQTVVTYEQADGVIKYYSGIEEITVGNTGFEDIVVMSIGSNEIVVNADKVAIDAAPIVQNDRTYVPFRALAEAFGATVAYDEATQAVTAELNGTTVVMTIGSATYTINGVEKTMDVAPFINGSRTMIPVRFAAEAFGITVTPTYDENGATADVLFAK